MKIVLITPYYTLSMQRKVSYLAMRGAEIFQVIPTTCNGQANPVLVNAESLANHHLIPVKLFHQVDPHRSFLNSALVWLKSFAPDLIAVEWDPDTLMALQVALARRLWAPQSKLLLHSWQNVTRPLKISVRVVLSYTLQSANAICCANQAGPAVLCQWGYQGQSIVQPWMGVDTSIFYRRQVKTLLEPIDDAGFIIGYVGRLVPEKGLTDLILAMSRLPIDIQCVFIGSGPDETKLRQLAQTQGVAERVHFLGQVTNETLVDYLSQFNVLVLPSHTTSVWQEQYGRVLLEAMACEVPIIGSSCGAISEVVGEAGLIFPEGDIDRLTDCIQTLYQNSGLAYRLGQAGYTRVMTHYSQEQIALRAFQIYQTVAQR